MQFGAAGSTVHGPAETVKYTILGGGGGGARGGSGGARGGGGLEHTRQPVETVTVSEDQKIDPLPNTKLEGPFVSSNPAKATSVPAVLYILRKSYPASVEKAVAVMLLPMASEVGLMSHVMLVDPAPRK
jgi:hypothetical protein